MAMNTTGWYARIKKITLVKKIRIWRQLYQGTYRYLLPSKKVLIAERQPARKQDLVEKQLRRFPEKASKLESNISRILHAGNGVMAQSSSIVLDMYFSYFAYGYTPNEYVCYQFSEKSLPERRQFLSDRDSVRYGYRMNDIDAFPIFTDKFCTYQKFREYYKREIISIRTEKDKPAYLEFLQKHPVFIKKITNESCGRGIEKIDQRKETRSSDELFSDLLSQGGVVLEECVRQGKVMSRLNSSSVNTVRCITLKTKNTIAAPYCFLKVGRAGSFIDNGGAGGILVGINSANGILDTDGVDELGRRYPSHPDSGVVFRDFILPEWEQLLSICKEMAGKIPGINCIGWDMAYTEDGWAVIEGNVLTEVIGPQATSQKGIRDSLNAFLMDMELPR